MQYDAFYMLKWFIGLIDLEEHTARDKQAI